MKDRVVQYPSRYQLVPVAGTTDQFDLVAVPGIVTEAGTDLNKAALLKDTTGALYGLSSSAVPDDVLAAIPPILLPKAYDLILATTTNSAATQIDVTLPSLTNYAALVVDLRLLCATELNNLMLLKFNDSTTSIYIETAITGGTGTNAEYLNMGSMQTVANGYFNEKIEISLEGKAITGQYFANSRNGSGKQGKSALFEVSASALSPSALAKINVIGVTPSGIASGSKVYVYGVKK